MQRRTFFIMAGLALLVAGTSWAGENISPKIEAEQLAILRSNAPPAEKALACKRLAIDGSNASVPDLAKLLSDRDLASWSRIALEAIPGSDADAALRKAAESLDGLLLVGVLNSIGVRRDAQAVDLLISKLEDKDPEVAAAAAVALGRVANEPATKALQARLGNATKHVRSAAAEGCVLCAERLMADGKLADSAALYEQIRKADVPRQRVVEATRGVILARGDEGLPLLLEQLRGSDKQLFEVALGTAREIAGNKIDKLLSAELPKLSEAKAVAVIATMADRPETVDVNAVVASAAKGPKPVRLAAIQALARVGNDTCLETLFDTTFGADADLSAAARDALGDLPGKSVNAKIIELLANADAKRLPLLLSVVGQRRIDDAVPTVVKSLDHKDQAVRSSAFAALSETVDLPQLNILVEQVVSPKFPSDMSAAQDALRKASVRMPDRDACSGELAKALAKSPDAVKVLLLEILAEVGGEKALATLGAAAKSADPQMQDAGSRVLGKWNGVDAAPVLLDLAKNGPVPQYRTRALRGYIGLVRKFAMPEDDCAAMCQTALDLSKQAAEQKLVLEVLKLHPSKATLAVAIKAMGINGLKDDASQAVLLIAQKTKAPEVADMLARAGFEKVKVEITKAQYGAGNAQRDVTSILQKQVGDLPLVTLPGKNYNSSFGEDPAPGSVKNLKVWYRINGKEGEATFAENDAILLPTP